MTLRPKTVFRNATSRYLHAGVQVFQGAPGTIQLNCGGDGFGIVASYDGSRTVTIRSGCGSSRGFTSTSRSTA